MNVSDMVVTDPLIRVAVSECVSQREESESALCSKVCNIAGDSGLSLLHIDYPSVCNVSCDEVKKLSDLENVKKNNVF